MSFWSLSPCSPECWCGEWQWPLQRSWSHQTYWYPHCWLGQRQTRSPRHHITSHHQFVRPSLGESYQQDGAAALAEEAHKLHSNGPRYQELGWSCIPLAVETYSNWGKEAHDTISRRHPTWPVASPPTKSTSYQFWSITGKSCKRPGWFWPGWFQTNPRWVQNFPMSILGAII